MNKFLDIRFIQSSIKNTAIFILTLVIVSVVLLSARYNPVNSIVIYAQQLERADFIQVFFPTEDSYNEKNSKRSIVFGGSEHAIKIALPKKTVTHVRIDPANSATKVIIKKIKLKYMLGSKIYTPNDLSEYSKSIQMIDKLEVVPEGLIVYSTGDDPIFELQLNIPSLSSQLLSLGLSSFAFSVVLFLGAIKFKNKTPKLWTKKIKIFLLSVPVKVYLIAIPLFASLVITVVFYPGAMSYDTLHGLRGARNGVTDSIWPPMVSYVWRIVDMASSNPSAMHFSQVFVLILSVFFVVYAFTKKITYATLFLVLYLSIPVILGTLAVIWKDVLMASFLILGFALITFLKSVKIRWQFNALCLITIFVLFVAICTRHNAITGAVPLIFYLSWVVVQRFNISARSSWASLFVLGALLTSTTFGAKSYLDTHTLPDFELMQNETGRFIEGTQILDVAGASLCVGKNLYSDEAQFISVADIDSMYDPKHVNLSAKLFTRPELRVDIDKIWWRIALNHPICFFSNKYNLTRYMIGANEGGQFLITHPRIDENEFGYVFKESLVRDAFFNYINNASHVHIMKPWFIYLLSIIGFFFLLYIKGLSVANFTMFMSGYFYFGGLVIFGNAADARLLFYTTTTLSVFVFISAIEFIKWKNYEKLSRYRATV